MIKMNKKSKIGLVVLIFLIVIVIIGGSYAFFEAIVDKTNNNTAGANIVAKQLKLELSDGAQVNIIDALPGAKFIKTFSVTNTGNTAVSYNLSFLSLINNFTRKSDLIYSITSTNSGYATSEDTQLPAKDYTVGMNISIPANTTQDYTLVIEYKNLSEDQSDDMGSQASFKIAISDIDEFYDDCPYAIGYEVLMPYNGATSYEFNVLCNGTYKLEAWGAAGGDAYNTYMHNLYPTNSEYVYPGGNGGYATGMIYLNEGDTLYTYVGEEGTQCDINSTNRKCNTAFNGGGEGYVYQSSDSSSAGGGGATHIGTFDQTLAIHGTTDGLYLVAGAGGGGHYTNSANRGFGGAGGGLTGGNISELSSNVNPTSYPDRYASPGNQSTGGCSLNNAYCGSFGQGGNATSNGGSGGGSGLYGGSSTNISAGAGGSSYIGGVNNGQTIDGASEMPTYDGTGTMIGNDGAGYAKITYISKN